MSELVYHIGSMKTATTYLQGILSANRQALEERNWIYPGDGTNQQTTFYELCGQDIDWIDHPPRGSRRSARLRNVLADESKNRIISVEALANLEEEGILRLLQVIPIPTKVVITTRPFTKIVPSAWQQKIREGYRFSLETYAQSFIAEFGEQAGSFYRTYAFGAAAQKWANTTGAPVTIVKVDGRGVDPWDTFRQATGLPTFEIQVPPEEERNSSLSLGSCEIIRRFNEGCAKQGVAEQRILKILVWDSFMALPPVELDSAKPQLPEVFAEKILELEDAEWQKAAAAGAVVLG